MTAALAADLLGAAMVDFAAGRRSPAWLRVAPGRRLTHDLAAYFAPVTAHEQALLDLAEGPVLDVGCGPARHARLLQARGLTAIGLDRSLLALGLARSLGLRHWLHADARSGPLPAVRTALLLDGNLGLTGTPAGAVQLLHRLATACGPAGCLLVGGRAPRQGWLRPLVLRDEYRDLVGPWGRWLQASLPAVLELAAPAGWRLQHALTDGALLGRPLPRPSMTGSACRPRRRSGDLVSPLRVGPLVAVLLLLAARRPPAAVVSLAPDAATRPGEVKPKLLALMPHPIALALAPDGLAVVDYGGAPGERGKGELRLIPGVASDAPADTSSSERANPSRLLASGLDGPTGVARLPDGRWAVAESGHTRLKLITGRPTQIIYR